MRKACILPVAALAVLGLGTLGSLKLVKAQTERADCPGKIVCPQTGQLICRDRCPTVDPNRPDCPGRIVCPKTGKLICTDRCPLNATAAVGAKAGDKPSCCTKGKR